MFPQLTGQSPRNPAYNSRGLGGDNRMIGPIATQNLGGNSLTQTTRSAQNYGLTQGVDTFDYGQGITGAGVQGFNTAGDTSGEALGTTRGALNTLSPAESYWTKLLSGDQATMNQAIAPYANQAGLNWANVQTAANNNMPRGGYSATVNAQAPAGLARQVNEQLFSLQPVAAQQMNQIAQTRNQIAGTQGNIAGVQGQLANWLSNIGIDVSKLGQNWFDIAMRSLMEGRGQDVAEHGQAMSLAGQTASSAAGLGGKIIERGCWIAEAVYGVNDPRTHLVRAWLNGPFRETKLGRIVMKVYLTVGKQVAWVARRSATVRALFRPLFDRALKRAFTWVLQG